MSETTAVFITLLLGLVYGLLVGATFRTDYPLTGIVAVIIGGFSIGYFGPNLLMNYAKSLRK